MDDHRWAAFVRAAERWALRRVARDRGMTQEELLAALAAEAAMRAVPDFVPEEWEPRD